MSLLVWNTTKNAWEPVLEAGMAGVPAVGGAQPAGYNPIPNPVVVGGVGNGGIWNIAVDTTGKLITVPGTLTGTQLPMSNVTARTSGSGPSSGSSFFVPSYHTLNATVTFSNVGVGGTSLQLILQQQEPRGTWYDIASWDTSTPSDATSLVFPLLISDRAAEVPVPGKTASGTLAPKTILPLAITEQVRIFEVVTGTYTTAPVYSLSMDWKL